MDSSPARCRLRSTREASAYLHDRHRVIRAPATLNKLRVVGGGPEFRRIGAKQIVYCEDALDTWAESLISEPLASTSQRAA